jgi:hypothetical protein
MKLPKLLLVLILSLSLTACSQLSEDEIEEIRGKKISYNEDDIRFVCENAGGHYETWSDGEVFCVFDGWGCDPLLFAKGLCSKEF